MLTFFRRLWVLSILLGVASVLFTPIVGAQSSFLPEDRPSRIGIEDIPHYPSAKAVTAQPQRMAPSVVPFSKLAFQSYRDGNWNIYVGNDDGSGQTVVTRYNGKPDIHPHLNRGGTAIVYASGADNHDYEIYRINPDGNGNLALTNNSTNDGNPQWSPDGNRIVFESYRDGQAEIYLMSPDGSNQTRLTNHSGFDGMPSWSPDGSKIAFSSDRSGGYRIWVMNADGSNPVQISNEEYSFRPQWSPNGNLIAYDADNDNSGWQELRVRNADGSQPRSIKSDLGNNADIWAGNWSPDGSYISFTEIHFIYYQGNWYWTEAYLKAINPTDGQEATLSPSNVDWYPRWQTYDTQLPTSQLQPLPPVSPGPVSLRWSGNDTGGSGIRSYDIQVKEGAAGTWTDWLSETTHTSASYDGVGGQTYYFRGRVRDNAYNIEPWPANPDASTTVENLPPTAVIFVPNFSRFDYSFPVSWNGVDAGGSGIASYDVEYKVNDGNWFTWLPETIETSTTIGGPGAPRDTYTFRVRAIDRAYNQGDWSLVNRDTQTIRYGWSIAGIAYDNTGAPVSNIAVTAASDLLGFQGDDPEGGYAAYLADLADIYEIGWSKNGYSSLPPTEFAGAINGNAAPDGRQNVFLPPANNIVRDGGFESGSFSNENWQTPNIAPAQIISDVHHTGHYAAMLGDGRFFTDPQTVFEASNQVIEYSMVIDATDTVHIMYIVTIPESNGGYHTDVLYTQHPKDGTWSQPESLAFGMSDSSTVYYSTSQLLLDRQGNLHMTWVGEFTTENGIRYSHIYYTYRGGDGVWAEPVVVSGNTYASDPEMAVGNDSIVHIVWQSDGENSIYYSRRNANGIWATPKLISLEYDARTEYQSIVVANNGVVHVIWREQEYGGEAHIYYARRGLDGVWHNPELIVDDHTDINRPLLLIDSKQDVHLLWQSFASYGEKSANVQYMKLHNNGWSTRQFIAQTDYFSNINAAMDKTDNLYLFWSSYMSDGDRSDILYLKGSSDGHWGSVETLPSGELKIAGSPQLKFDNDGLLHMVWVGSTPYNPEGSKDIYYSRRNANGIWLQPKPVSATFLRREAFPDIVLDSAGYPLITWLDTAYSDGTGLIYYGTPLKAEEAKEIVVSQVVTVPLTMPNPVLSFMYQLAGDMEDTNIGFVVEVDDGTAVTPLLTTTQETNGWQHAWASVATWRGKTITVTYQLHQPVNAPIRYARLDEVSIGSSYSDVGVAVTDWNAFAGSQATLNLTYGNRGGAAASGVVLTYTLPPNTTFVSASIPPTSTGPLTWELPDLPAKSEPQEISVTVRVNPSAPGFSTLTGTAVIATTSPELELLNNQAEGHIFTAAFRYLPAILR